MPILTQERTPAPEPPGAIDIAPLRPVLERYKHTEGSLITVLQAAQELYGYLPPPLLSHIARELKIKPSKVFGVVTFYAQFRTKPPGKHMVLLCQGTACHVNGSKEIERAVCGELGVKPGETTEDGLFTLENVACLGCCSLSPVMTIDGEAHGALTPAKAAKILRKLRGRRGEAPGEAREVDEQ